MKSFLSAALLGGFLMACATPPPVVETPIACASGRSFTEWEGRLFSSLPHIITSEYRDKKMSTLLNAYNKSPPQSNVKADVAYTYIRPGSPRVLVVFTLNNCIVGNADVSLSWLMLRLNEIRGIPAPPPGSIEA